jgi:hypothetical protein
MASKEGQTETAPRDFYGDDGRILASIVHHPRIEGAWLAMLCPELITRDKPSGWYRYKTFRGAVALVEKKIAGMAKLAVDMSA